MEGWADLGRAIVAFGAVAASLGVLARLRPVKWLFRTLIGLPLATWFRAEITTEVAPLIDAKLEPIQRQLAEIGGSVNNVKPGEPKLIDRVKQAADAATLAAEVAVVSAEDNRAAIQSLRQRFDDIHPEGVDEV